MCYLTKPFFICSPLHGGRTPDVLLLLLLLQPHPLNAPHHCACPPPRTPGLPVGDVRAFQSRLDMVATRKELGRGEGEGHPAGDGSCRLPGRPTSEAGGDVQEWRTVRPTTQIILGPVFARLTHSRLQREGNSDIFLE